MTVNKKTIVNTPKTLLKPDMSSDVAGPKSGTVKQLGVASMRRIVSKKLAVGKLVMAKRLS